jgi:hypothetical protein
MACVSDSDVLAPGKQHFDRGLLIGKIRVGIERGIAEVEPAK